MAMEPLIGLWCHVESKIRNPKSSQFTIDKELTVNDRQLATVF